MNNNSVYWIPRVVCEHIEDYFKNYLPYFKVHEVMKYKHPDDNYLYKVIAYNEETHMWAWWSCWNESTQSLNWGHYNFLDYDDCFNDCINHNN